MFKTIRRRPLRGGVQTLSQTQIKKIKRDRVGRFSKTQIITLREAINWTFRKGQWAFALTSLAFITFILIKPIEQFNPLLGAETFQVREVNAKENPKVKAEDTLDQRIEECWAKNWQPGVLETGFVCAAPAVDLHQK